MLHVPKQDWIVQNSMTTGLDDFRLAAEAPVGTSYFPFRHRFANGATVPTYWVTNNNPTAQGTKWEKYRGETLTYGPPLDQLSRDNLEASTDSDGPVSWQESDLPLLVYIVPDDAAAEFAVTMGLGPTRAAALRYGIHAKPDGLATGFDLLKFFDGEGHPDDDDGDDDDPVGGVNKETHEVTIYGLPANYLDGLEVSRNSTSVLGIAAGICMDATNVIGIRLGSAITKSTAGAWIAGSGQNGMADGLTVASDTTYHVFAGLADGLPDVFIDTSFTGANAPSAFTHFRRIRSCKTHGSAQLMPFRQEGDYVALTPPATSFSVNAPGTLVNNRTVDVPTGLKLMVRMIFVLNNSHTTTSAALEVGDPDGSNIQIVPPTQQTAGLSSVSRPTYDVMTNASAQIATQVTGLGSANVTVSGIVVGWFDHRGKDGNG